MAKNQTTEDWEQDDMDWYPVTIEFLPPPPRPPFLEDYVPEDGPTSNCGLCSWATAELPGPPRFDLPTGGEVSSHLPWIPTLIVVSLVSAFLGAVVMVAFIQCKNQISSRDSSQGIWCLRRRRRRRNTEDCVNNRNNSGVSEISSLGEASRTDGDKEVATVRTKKKKSAGLWSWLTRRTPPAPTLSTNAPSVPPVANHYTLDEAYTAAGEALYAELDRPAYQNTGYLSDVDPLSSAPSSAYYSDLSASDRIYEIPAQTGSWEMVEVPPRRQLSRLAAITETTTVPSDYV